MAQVGSLYTSLTLESSSFVSGLKKAVDQTASSAKSIERSLTQIKVGIAGLFAGATAQAVTGAIGRALDYASSLDEVSQQLGVTSRDLQVYRYAASQVGVSQEEMDKGLQKFTKSLSDAKAGVSSARGVFRELGFTDAEIKRLDAHDALLKTADGLAQLRDRTTRATPEVALLGRAGQQLDPLLAAGAAGIKSFADEAERAGLIMSDVLIQKADAAADKLSKVKQILEIRLASVVAENAGAIEILGNAFETAADKAGKFIQRVGGSLRILKTEGLVADVTASNSEKIEAGSDEGYRDRTKRQYQSARANYHADPSSAGLEAYRQAVQRFSAAQQRVTQNNALAEAARRMAASGSGGTKGYTDTASAASAAAKAAADAKAAEAARKKEIERQRHVADEGARLDDQWLSSRGQITADVVEQGVLERARLDRDSRRQLADLARDQADGKVTAEEARGLRSQIERNNLVDLDAINQRENIRLEQDAQSIADTRLGYMKEAAETEAALATSTKDRLAIALRILAAEKEAERAQLQAIADDRARPVSERHHSDAEITNAETGLSTLDQRYGGKATQARLQNSGPIEAYRRQISEATGDMNAALQSVEVDGLKGLEDGLTGLISGTESVGSAFKKMAESIIADLARIAIEKAVIGPLLNALSGGANTGLGGLTQGLFANDNIGTGAAPLKVGDIQLPGFATGGSFTVGGYGGTDTQLMQFMATPGEMVNITKGNETSGGGTVHQTINVQGGVDLATRTETYRLAGAVHDSTLRAVTDKSRRAG